MASPTTTVVHGGLFTSTESFKIKHRTEFRSETGDLPLRLTVRQDVTSRAGFKKLGRSIHVFEFEPAGAATASNSPTTATGRASAAGDLVVAARGGEESTTASVQASENVVLVHNRYNGSKQLYVNQAMVYSVAKECTDGNMNLWVIPLSFGNVGLKLTCKLFCASGFEYTLSLGDIQGPVLFKGTS